MVDPASVGAFWGLNELSDITLTCVSDLLVQAGVLQAGGLKAKLSDSYERGRPPVNHDLEQAVRLAQINAGLVFLDGYERSQPNEARQDRGLLDAATPALRSSYDAVCRHRHLADIGDVSVRQVIKSQTSSAATSTEEGDDSLGAAFIRDLVVKTNLEPSDHLRRAIFNGSQGSSGVPPYGRLFALEFMRQLKRRENAKTALTTQILGDISVRLDDIETRIREPLGSDTESLEQRLDDFDKDLRAGVERLDKRIEALAGDSQELRAALEVQARDNRQALDGLEQLGQEALAYVRAIYELLQREHRAPTREEIERERREAAQRRLAEMPTGSDAPVPDATEAPLPDGSVPPPIRPNPRFRGRDHKLRELASLLGPDAAVPAVVAIRGVVGMGKTQLAAEFAHRYGPFFTGACSG